MTSTPQPVLRDFGKTLLRFKIAAICLIVAAVLGFIAYRFQTRTYFITQKTSGSAERFDKIWFDAKNRLGGARREGGFVRLQRGEKRFEIPAAGLVSGESGWAVSDGFETAAWITADALYFQRAGGEVRSRTMTGRAVSVAILYDDVIAVTFSDGTVSRWYAGSGEGLPVQQLELGSIQQALAVGDYLAVGSAERVALYRYRDGRWAQTESEEAPSTGYRLVIPAPGSFALIAGGALRVAGETRNTRGSVRSVVSHRGTLIAAGEFENVWVATSAQAEEEDYVVAEASAGAVLAIGGNRLALSTRAGTSLYDLSTEERLTATGRMATVLSFLNAMAAILLALAPALLRQILKLFATMLGGRLGGGGMGGWDSSKLPSPPTLLIERTAASRSVLWAGSGLSTQSGTASRAAFVANWVSTGVVEGWLSSSEFDRLQRLMMTSGSEAVMNQLSTEKPRHVNAGQIQAMIPKYPQLSRCHELLAVIPFAAAFTTNYDDLLDRMRARWTGVIVTPESEEVPRLSGVPFLMKLYGHLSMPATVRLARGKLAEDFPVGARQLINAVGSMNTVLFVGASLEGLLADLDALGLADLRGGTHFAVVGTSNAQWRKVANELKGRYSIEVLACSEEAIASELPRFLGELQAAVAMIRPMREPAPELEETAA